MRFKTLLLASYLAALPVVIGMTVLISLYFFHQGQTSLKSSWGITKAMPHYEALPQERSSIKLSISSEDARTDVLEEFFTRHDSPLLGHAQTFVDVSDKYSLDYRLLPAIAMQESNLCKKAPPDSHNCWGFGIYGGNVVRFASYEDAIEAVAKGIANDYVALGLTSPELIMTKYTPGSDGSWAQSVNFFMDHIHMSL